jgi:serine/threonine protein kinase
MKASQAIHPTDQTLQSYGLGKLDDLLVEVVSKHLDSCSDCQRRVAAISADSFLGKLRDAQGKPITSAPVVSSTGSPSRPAAGPSSPAPPLSETLPPGLADHPDYEILRELGRGGMGVVYLAQNKLMGRHEVLKVVSSHLVNRPGVMERFLGEIRNAAQLHHPNIVTAYSALRFDESLVLAMEYVEGLDLDKTVQAKGPLSAVHACYFIHQAALGLQHAHEYGMVHRDIKPGNLMLVRLGNRAVVKILDFGLAKVRRERTGDGAPTAAGQLLGTPDFIAPEQINDARQADIRADIYSLGCTFYFLLTGRPPFQATTLYEIYQAHHSMDAPLLNLVRPDVPMELAVVVATMMAKEPERRFQTPKEVSQALAPFLKKESPAAPQSKPELSLANAAMPPQQSAGTGRVPTQPAMNAAPAPPALSAAKPAEPTQAGSAWDTLIETNPEKSLSDEVRALRESRGVPPWMWPLVAVSLLIIGVVVGWRLSIESGTNRASSVASQSPDMARGKIVPPATGRNVTEATHARYENQSDLSASKRESSDSRLASRDRKNAPSFDSSSPGRGDASRQDDTNATAKTEPAATKPAPTQIVDAPKSKPAAEPAPDVASPEAILLVKRGLKKVGLFYVVATEDEIDAGVNKVIPFFNVMDAAWIEVDKAVRIENYAQQLDDTRINLQAYINDLNVQLGSLPNTVVNRLARQGLQQEIQAAQANLGNANREFAIAIKRVVPPRKKQALIDEFMKRRADFLEATKDFKPTVDKAMKEYNELKKDEEVMSAIKVLKEKERAPLAIGPSAGFKKAIAGIRKAEQMVSYNPEVYDRRTKARLKQSPKGKMPSMPSKMDGQ